MTVSFKDSLAFADGYEGNGLLLAISCDHEFDPSRVLAWPQADVDYEPGSLVVAESVIELQAAIRSGIVTVFRDVGWRECSSSWVGDQHVPFAYSLHGLTVGFNPDIDECQPAVQYIPRGSGESGLFDNSWHRLRGQISKAINVRAYPANYVETDFDSKKPWLCTSPGTSTKRAFSFFLPTTSLLEACRSWHTFSDIPSGSTDTQESTRAVGVDRDSGRTYYSDLVDTYADEVFPDTPNVRAFTTSYLDEGFPGSDQPFNRVVFHNMVSPDGKDKGLNQTFVLTDDGVWEKPAGDYLMTRLVILHKPKRT